MLETLRGEGAPPPACRAVVHAALRYVDAELLNALMLRRDACSTSAVKALQARAHTPCHPSGPPTCWPLVVFVPGEDVAGNVCVNNGGLPVLHYHEHPLLKH